MTAGSAKRRSAAKLSIDSTSRIGSRQKAVVTVRGTGAARPGGTVSVKANGRTVGSRSLARASWKKKSGVWRTTVTVKLSKWASPGTKKLRAVYSGDARLRGANSNLARVRVANASAREYAVLKLVNQARSKARKCGSVSYAPAKRLTWNNTLGNVSGGHSTDMATRDYFSHTSPKGADIVDRVNAAKYRWRAVGENIAAGQPTPSAVVKAWLASPGHCANIMNPSYTQLGVGYAYDSSSSYSVYWTQVFARPR